MEEHYDKSNMPNFLIIGLARSGSSSLFKLLGQHPQIFTTTQRAPNFFGLGEQPEYTWNGPLKRHPKIVDSYEEYLQLYSGKEAETRWGEGSSFFNFTIRGLERIH